VTRVVDERHVISDRLDDTLVVEAAAGTGKTTQLVARIVALLTTGRARLTEIVAVTFSEKAAGELKLRLREEVERARLAAVPGSDQDRRLDAAVREFEEAHLSTIHGFCAELLRERPVEAQIDPSFEVMTETQSDQLFDQAFNAWLETTLGSPGEGVKRSLRRPRQVWWWRDDEEEDGPIARLRKAARELREWRDFPEPWKRPVWDRPAMIDAVVQSVLDVAAMTATPIYEHDMLFHDTTSLRRAAAEIKRLAAQSPRDYDGLEAQLATLANDRDLAGKRKGSGAMYSHSVSRQAVLEKREALSSLLKNFKAVADADLAGLLHAELQGCMELYQERKRRTGALDFLDLLIRARDLVHDCAPVRYGFQKRFKYILVDEFQDTDPLQAELLLMLASDDSGRPRRGALFIVGDPKQSIYRFRRADVGVYLRVCDDLQGEGVRPVKLKQSFRSVPNLQRFVNAAFRPEMKYDPESLQADYVELAEHRPDIAGQPSVIALPVPKPYGRFRIARKSIDECLPDAVAEFVRWLLQDSGWKVTTADEGPRRVAASDICLLFRRFIAYQDDVTRRYVEALEARGVPHLLVGGKTFHEREEVDAVRTALAAIEWPEDELSIFATLRGPLFALGDEELLEYHACVRETRHGHAFHPYHVPADLPSHLQPIGDALGMMRDLHAGRNYRPVADTIGRLIDRTRAHAGFMLWRGGEQVLGNVLHIAELARQYEAEGGLSFRGFVEMLRSAADRAQAPEAPILEEGSDGVRLMTVHKAKGLEFPAVILADISCGLSREDAQRYIDPAGKLCAVRLAGWAPLDLLENNDREAKRDRAEGVRLAYVAATRARDLLVVPAVGDEPFDDSWLSPLNEALYPPLEDRQSPKAAVGCPPFKGKDTVLERPDGEQPGSATVRPGHYDFVDPGSNDRVSVVWWDPLLLQGTGDDTRGLRRDDLISKEARPEDVAADRARYDAWCAARVSAREMGAQPSLLVMTATEWAHAVVEGSADPRLRPTSTERSFTPANVSTEDAGVAGTRPSGKRFGVLVHALLAAVPLDADSDQIDELARLHAKVIGAPDEERDEAARVVDRVLRHRVLKAAREAAACHREAPVSIVVDGVLIDGQVDLAFETDEGWTVVDFKTDAEIGGADEVYRRQVGLYAQAIARVTGQPSRGLLLRV
jgi:ATP-dependent helicase/nuclease subunit A